MTNDETKDAGQLMVDWASDKFEVQWKQTGCENPWCGVYTPEPIWNWHTCTYRRKPTPTLRPYTSAECIELVGKSLVNKGTGIPWGVVYLHVGMDCAFCRLQIATGYRQFTVSSEDLLAGWTHADGSPCGMGVE